MRQEISKMTSGMDSRKVEETVLIIWVFKEEIDWPILISLMTSFGVDNLLHRRLFLTYFAVYSVALIRIAVCRFQDAIFVDQR